VLAAATAGAFQQVAQLLGANGSTLSLVAPLFTVTVLPGEFEAGATSEGGVALLANFLPGTGPGALGQGLRPGGASSPEEVADEPAPAQEEAPDSAAAPPALPVWDRVAMGLERAWEQVRSEVLERAGLGDGTGAGPVASPGRARSAAPAASRPSNRPQQQAAPAPRAGMILPSEKPSRPTAGRASLGEAGSVGVTDAAIEEFAAQGRSEVGPSRGDADGFGERILAGRGRLVLPIATAAAMASAAAVALAIHSARNRRRGAPGASRPPASAH
jgi:hypothetical protein